MARIAMSCPLSQILLGIVEIEKKVTGELALCLRALAEGLSSVPRTRVGQRTAPRNSGNRESENPSDLQRHCTHEHTPTHRHTHIQGRRHLLERSNSDPAGPPVQS